MLKAIPTVRQLNVGHHANVMMSSRSLGVGIHAPLVRPSYTLRRISYECLYIPKNLTLSCSWRRQTVSPSDTPSDEPSDTPSDEPSDSPSSAPFPETLVVDSSKTGAVGAAKGGKVRALASLILRELRMHWVMPQQSNLKPVNSCFVRF